MDKETLWEFLRPFTDEIPVKVRFRHHDRGEVIEDVTGIAYGFENDGDGVVYLELADR